MTCLLYQSKGGVGKEGRTFGPINKRDARLDQSKVGVGKEGRTFGPIKSGRGKRRAHVYWSTGLPDLLRTWLALSWRTLGGERHRYAKTRLINSGLNRWRLMACRWAPSREAGGRRGARE